MSGISDSAPSHRPRVARQRASVARGFVTGMLAGAQRAGHDAAPWLTAAGIDIASPASRIPLDRYADLYNRVVDALEDEGFALFSQALRPGCFEFLCRVMLGAPSLAEALERASGFLRLVLPDLVVVISRDASTASLQIVEQRSLADAPNDAARVFAFEWLLRLLHGLACWIVGRGLALDAVDFPYARPQHADDYALVYTEHSRFGGTRLTAHLNANLLDLPTRRDDAALAAFLDGAPGKITMVYRRDREMVQRVRDLLRDALPVSLTVEAVARKVHMSQRTLHRRLEEEGSGFRRIKDAIRRDIALARLRKGTQPIAELAAELGYADPSAFYRAVVAWTGRSPERVRRQSHAAGDGAPPATR